MYYFDLGGHQAAPWVPLTKPGPQTQTRRGRESEPSRVAHFLGEVKSKYLDKEVLREEEVCFSDARTQQV